MRWLRCVLRHMIVIKTIFSILKSISECNNLIKHVSIKFTYILRFLASRWRESFQMITDAVEFSICEVSRWKRASRRRVVDDDDDNFENRIKRCWKAQWGSVAIPRFSRLKHLSKCLKFIYYGESNFRWSLGKYIPSIPEEFDLRNSW